MVILGVASAEKRFIRRDPRANSKWSHGQPALLPVGPYTFIDGHMRTIGFGKISPVGKFIAAALLSAQSAMAAPMTKGCDAPPLPITGALLQVSTEAELQNAMKRLKPGTTILIANGVYNLSNTLHVNNVNNITIRGAAGCDDVVLIGRGMTNANFGSVRNGIWTNSSNTVIAHLTLRDFYQHPVILNPGAQAPRFYSVRITNGGQQLIKANPASPSAGVDNGIVENSVLEFETTSRDHYTNGVDVITGSGWIIRDNLFRNIRAPVGQLAGPAVLMWGGSRDTIVERNLFLNTQRGIALGLQPRAPSDHSGGIVRNNVFFRRAGETGDTGIYIADSPNTKVLHNTVLVNGTYPHAIEYRFPQTTGVEIRFNLTDARIVSRDGASATVANNFTSASNALFVNPAANDLHLRSASRAVIDQAAVHMDVTDDFDGEPRPSNGRTTRDMGADEIVKKGM